MPTTAIKLLARQPPKTTEFATRLNALASGLQTPRRETKTQWHSSAAGWLPIAQEIGKNSGPVQTPNC